MKKRNKRLKKERAFALALVAVLLCGSITGNHVYADTEEAAPETEVIGAEIEEEESEEQIENAPEKAAQDNPEEQIETPDESGTVAEGEGGPEGPVPTESNKSGDEEGNIEDTVGESQQSDPEGSDLPQDADDGNITDDNNAADNEAEQNAPGEDDAEKAPDNSGAGSSTLSATTNGTNGANNQTVEPKFAKDKPDFTGGKCGENKDKTDVYYSDKRVTVTVNLTGYEIVEPDPNNAENTITKNILDRVEITYKDINGEEKSEKMVHLESDDDNIRAYVFENNGNYLIEAIKVYKIGEDEATDTIENINQSICIYNENDDENNTNAGFIDIKNYDSKWYSEAVNGASHIRVEANTARYITKIEVIEGGCNTVSTFTNDSAYALYGMNKLEADIDIPQGKEGHYDYDLKVEFQFGNKCEYEINDIDIRIDNTAPKPANNKIPWRIVNPESYAKENDICYTNKPVDVEILVGRNTDSDRDDRFREVSGLAHVTYKPESVTEEPIDFAPDWTYTGIISDKWKALTEEGTIYLDKVTLTDHAGNSAEYDAESDYKIVYDNLKPRIDIGEDAKSFVSLDDGSRLYKGSLKGTISIKDITLARDKIDIQNTAGKNKLDLKESENSTDTDVEYSYKLESEGAYKIEAKAVDKAGNPSEAQSNVMIIDNTAPQIAVKYTSNGMGFNPQGVRETFKNGNVTVTVSMREEYPDLDNCVLTVNRTDINGNETVETYNNWTSGSSSEHSISYTTPEDGEYVITIAARDLVGNEATGTGSEGFTVDSTRPEMSVKFNTDDAVNGKYYNKERIASIEIIDSTFSEDKVDIDISEQYGKAAEEGWRRSGNVYTKQIRFAQDGVYSMKLSCEDSAGNKADEISEEEFVIDTTAPEINVSYDNNSPVNDIYYNAARTANINITERNIDGELVKVGALPLSDVSALPERGNLSSDGENNSMSLSFTQDGTYGYTVECTDLAGNTSTVYTSDKFVIDTTEPEIAIEGIENYSANNGTVAPVISLIESNVDSSLTEVTLTGANNGPVNRQSSITPTDNGEKIAFADFEHTKETDDLYVLNVKAKDLAGNEKEDQIVFSVNRFGSVYVLNDDAKLLNEEYYTNKAKSVSITEINVDDLVSRDVMIGRDGDYYDLKEGKSLKVSKEGDAESWKRYTYSISASAFEKDGIYAVGVSSVDRATNSQDSRSRDAAVDFALDTTSPEIITPDLKNGAVYDEKEHRVNLNVTDNMGVTDLKIYSDKELIEEYDQDELSETAGTVSFVLKGDDKEHDIHVLTSDMAGNNVEIVYERVYVGTKKAASEGTDVVIKDDVVPSNNDLDNHMTDHDKKTVYSIKNALLYTAMVLIVIALGAGTGVVIVRKNRKKEQ